MLLYVHPCGHANDAVVPAGSIAAVNSLECDKLGRYAFELRDHEIERAKVVAVDLHWALGLPGLEALVGRVRALNPSARVVVGGISATLWAERLLREGLADFVVQGDFEPGFPRLVEALLAGVEPGALPNVRRPRAAPSAPVRATEECHDASSSVVAEWFPSYERMQSVSAQALSHDRTLAVARGCSRKCADCHGSSNDAFGGGVLVRSVESVVREVQRADRAGARHLVLLFGKLGTSAMRERVVALARSGPFGVSEHVGVFACQAPDDETLRALLEAFPCKIGISVVDPAEHAPRSAPERVTEELGEWRRVARVVRSEPRLELVLWSENLARLESLRSEVGADGERMRVAWSGAWNVVRPMAANAGADFDEVQEAVTPFWSFVLARALSPSLARILEPFGFLDELPDEPAPPPDLPERWVAHADEAYAGWRKSRLPTFPSLAFAAIPLAGSSSPRLGGQSSGASRGRRRARRVSGDVLVSRPREPIAVDLGRVAPLRFGRDARGPRFTVALRVEPSEAIVVAPMPIRGPMDAEWLATLARDGLVMLLPQAATAAAADGACALELRLAFDAAVLSLRNGADRVIRSGWIDGGLYADGHPLDGVLEPPDPA